MRDGFTILESLVALTLVTVAILAFATSMAFNQRALNSAGLDILSARLLSRATAWSQAHCGGAPFRLDTIGLIVTADAQRDGRRLAVRSVVAREDGSADTLSSVSLC